MFQPLLICAVMLLGAPPPSADEIMQRVAANQDRAQALRAAYVYQQKIFIRITDSKGKLRAQESNEYVVTPDATATKKTLASRSGRYWHKGRYVDYQQGDEDAAADDGDVKTAAELRDELTGDEGSRDGLQRKLFPLRSGDIARYTFTLKGEETVRGIPVYRIAFAPAALKCCEADTSEGPWAGEVLVSRDEFQPVEVVTRLAKPLPAAVRVLLGVNLHGVGYSVRYQKFDDGVWFPVSYGTEFFVRALFFWARHFTVSLANSGFHRADVKSTVRFPAEQ